jgi:hypothetical protein
VRRRLLWALAASAVLFLMATGTASADPVVACTGDPTGATRLDLTVAGTPTYGLYAVPAGVPKGLVVVDHGYSHTVESWRRHVIDMAKRDGVIAVAMDYRFTKDIPPTTAGGLPSSRGWRVQEGADDSIAVARLFDAQCPGLPSIDLYSVSMGGNAAGLAAAAKAKRVDGRRPLWDYWFDVEGAVNVSETYNEARAVAQTGNTFAGNAQQDIEAEMGGTFEQKPDVYAMRTVVNRVDDIKTAGLKGVVLVHGVGDGLVPYNQSQEMVSRLRQVGIPSDLFSVGTRGSGEAGTTLDGSVIGGIDSSYTSSFAGHASEASDTHLVGTTGFDRLAAFFTRGEAPCDRAFAVDGNSGTVAPDPATTPPMCTVDFKRPGGTGPTGGGRPGRGGGTGSSGRSPLGLSAASACTSRKRFRLRLRAPRHARIVEATVSINGRSVKRRRGRNVRAVVLRNLPAGPFKVKVVAITSDHRRIVATRRFLACGAKGRHRHRRHRRARGAR